MGAVRARPGVSTESGIRLTAVQQRRRRAIVDAAMELAAEGGYDAVQMREVAARGNVALGTLYRYFPSKEQLLVAAMAEQVITLRGRLAERPPAGDTPAQRVMDDLRRANRALQRQPNVTSAMLKSLIAGGDGEELAEMMEPISEHMTAIIVSAMGHEEPDEHDRAVAEVIQHVWMAALLWWVAGHAPASHVEDTVNRAVKLLLGNGG
jgi:AcrR family transcriptional regulator